MKSLKANIILLVCVAIVVVGAVVYKNWQKDDSQSPADNTGENVELVNLQIGDSEAPITIIEYFNYFCGYCGLFHRDTFPEIKEKYIDTGKVNFIYRPLDLGLFALCANDQDKFLEYHEYLFEKIAEVKEIEDAIRLAKEIGMDEDEFNECIDSEKYLEEMQKWHTQSDADFTAVNVPVEQRGTPAFFINGDLLLGAQPLENFEAVIDAKLAE